MKVLLTRKYFDQDLAYIKSKLISDEISIIDPEKYDEDSLLTHVGIHQPDVLLGEFFSDGLLQKATNLKFIQVPWTGVDRINFGLLSKHSVQLCNSHSNAQAVAEHAVTLLLSLLRMIPYHDHQLREGNWGRPTQENDPNFYPPISLIGKSIGFVGYGAIAKEIRNLLSGFNCQYSALVNNPEKHKDEGLAWVGKGDEKFTLAKRNKIIVVAAALTDDTSGMIDAAFLEELGPDGIIVNVSRGQLLNEEDVYQALALKKIAGAALDTWYQYPKAERKNILPSKLDFHALDNVLLSPHRAGFLKGKLPHLDDAIVNINNSFQGLPLKSIVNKANYY